MFKIKWDKDSNGIILSNNISDTDIIIPPRPVYLDELVMLGFDKVVLLPDENVPVCWALDKKYFYKGVQIGVAKGGNIYTDPLMEFATEDMPKTLEPINIDCLIKKNEAALYALENEAIDFIKNTYEVYENRVADCVVAFSGGKDSQVILDLVSRVLPPEKYKAIFTDTGMELPCTQDTVIDTEKFYKARYPGFQFHHAVSDKDIIELWKSYGPPSRVNRWCCSVRKTALFGRKMKDLLNTETQPRVLVFEGVRAEESSRRESYDRIGQGVKHVNLINCRAIFKWNLTEIYLYMIYRGIHINPAYKMGLTRVGCSVCPFASDWSEFVIRKHYPKLAQQFIDVIQEMALNIGIRSQNEVDDYISSGNWKKNAGGKGLTQDESRIDIIAKEPTFECIIMKPKTDWRTWLRTLATDDFLLNSKGPNKWSGEFDYKGEIKKFEVEDFGDKVHFMASATTNKVLYISHLTKAFTKAAFCESCGVCEVECPTGALKIRNGVSLDMGKCIHCNSCFNINTKGCIIATRRLMYEGGKVMGGTATKTSGIDKYSTFGIRDTDKDPWLSNFFARLDDWFVGYTGLGPKQIPAMLSWMREAELVDSKDKKTTPMARLLAPLYTNQPHLVWQIIWANLSFNSAIVHWYTEKLKTGVVYNRVNLLESLKEEYPKLHDATLGNPISALLNTFASTPLGGTEKAVETDDHNLRIGVLTKVGSGIHSIEKVGTPKISPIAVAYLLYKNAEENGAYEITVSDIYERGMHGVHNVYGLPIEVFLNALRALMNIGILNVDLLGGLDNIHLNKDVTSMQILQNMLTRLQL